MYMDDGDTSYTTDYGMGRYTPGLSGLGWSLRHAVQSLNPVNVVRQVAPTIRRLAPVNVARQVIKAVPHPSAALIRRLAPVNVARQIIKAVPHPSVAQLKKYNPITGYGNPLVAARKVAQVLPHPSVAQLKKYNPITGYGNPLVAAKKILPSPLTPLQRIQARRGGAVPDAPVNPDVSVPPDYSPMPVTTNPGDPGFFIPPDQHQFTPPDPAGQIIDQAGNLVQDNSNPDVPMLPPEQMDQLATDAMQNMDVPTVSTYDDPSATDLAVPDVARGEDTGGYDGQFPADMPYQMDATDAAATAVQDQWSPDPLPSPGVMDDGSTAIDYSATDQAGMPVDDTGSGYGFDSMGMPIDSGAYTAPVDDSSLNPGGGSDDEAMGMLSGLGAEPALVRRSRGPVSGTLATPKGPVGVKVATTMNANHNMILGASALIVGLALWKSSRSSRRARR